ncbi:MAG TPA: D-alanyl-D-alanine carboxypeptidase/D-alanyl-D-alanine-endopeptidase [Chitinophagaceae bacterium]|nr:D-alanyl-D-alanine carboxypeptidase/D-alanyl-D-alanine-endopeptidase [Chitinophagaceae bacterium]
MKKLFLFATLLAFVQLNAQTIKSKFNAAFKKFEDDPSFTHATISLYVINSLTGKAVAMENIQEGMAPASCQKVVTASTAFELLGHDFTYKTTLGYSGNLKNGILDGDIIIKGEGDPSLGSWRYDAASEENIISIFKKAISQEGIHEINGDVIADESKWQGEVTPDGWIWQDIGSYYGAGARAIDWRENQYDLLLKSGKKIGDSVEIAGTIPSIVIGLTLKSMATSAETGSGDNAYIYFPLNKEYGYVRGTIPVNEDKFSISGAMPHPANQLAVTLEAALKKQSFENVIRKKEGLDYEDSAHIFYTYNSLPLDSIVYWFLKRSINLYGEALLKTLGYELTKSGSVDSGVSVVKKFWQKKGIEPSALNIIDGSGLSPGNRITTASLVTVLEYAKKQKWFSSFYNALPEINGIKMKSGSIGGVVSYTGFIKSKAGDAYTFAFIINNYDGDANTIRKKMWRLLDVLK